MQTNISYYFTHLDEFPIETFFDGLTQPWEPLTRAKNCLQTLLVDSDRKDALGDIKDNVHFYDNYYIGEDTIIYNDVTVMGPVYIGKNCEIMPGAIIRPWSILGDNCSVGHGAEIKHSIIMNGAKIASTAFVGDSVLGKSARIGSGTIIANRLFNQSEIKIKLPDGTRLGMGDSYFGCVLGDNSRVGANCVTQPGTFIGPYSWIYPMTNVRGFIPAQKRVFHEKIILMEDNEIIDLKP